MQSTAVHHQFFRVLALTILVMTGVTNEVLGEVKEIAFKDLVARSDLVVTVKVTKIEPGPDTLREARSGHASAEGCHRRSVRDLERESRPRGPFRGVTELGLRYVACRGRRAPGPVSGRGDRFSYLAGYSRGTRADAATGREKTRLMRPSRTTSSCPSEHPRFQRRRRASSHSVRRSQESRQLSSRSRIP